MSETAPQPSPAQPSLKPSEQDSPQPSPPQSSPPTPPPDKSADAELAYVSHEDKELFAELLVSVEFTTPDLRDVSSLKPDIMDPMSLEESLSVALRNNFEIQSSQARTEGSRWDRLGAYLQYAPSIEMTNARGVETSSPGSYNGPDGSRIAETEHHRKDRSVFIRQPLIDMSVIADILKTQGNVKVADAERLDAQEGIAFDTLNVFLQLIQARKLIELSDDYQKQLGVLRDRMQTRFDGGGATNADLGRIQSRISVAEASRLEALGSYGVNLAEFKRLTGVVPARVELPMRLVPDLPFSVQLALERALKANPAYLGSLNRVDVARSDRNKSIANLLPKLSVEYSNVYNYNAGGAAHGNPIDGVYPTQEDNRVMLVARWSLTGGAALTAGFSGEAKVREMNFKAQDVRARIEQAMHTGYDSLNATKKRIAVLKDTYRTDKRIVSEMEDRFLQGGNASLFEILDSYDRLHSSKTELVKAVFAQALTSYRIRLQMGELVAAVLDEKVK